MSNDNITETTINLDEIQQIAATMKAVQDIKKGDTPEAVTSRDYPVPCNGVFWEGADGVAINDEGDILPLSHVPASDGNGTAISRRGLSQEKMRKAAKSSAAKQIVRDSNGNIVVIFAEGHEEFRWLPLGDANFAESHPERASCRCEPCQALAKRVAIGGGSKLKRSKKDIDRSVKQMELLVKQLSNDRLPEAAKQRIAQKIEQAKATMVKAIESSPDIKKAVPAEMLMLLGITDEDEIEDEVTDETETDTLETAESEFDQ